MQRVQIDPKVLLTTGPRICTVDDILRCIEGNYLNYRIHLGKRERDNLLIFKNIRIAENIKNVSTCVYLDLPSDRVRIDKLLFPYSEFRYIDLNKNDIVYLIFSDFEQISYSHKKYVCCYASQLKKYVHFLSIGDRVMFKDGNYVCEVLETHTNYIKLICKTSVRISPTMSCLFPDSEISYEIIDDFSRSFLKQLKLSHLIPDKFILSFVNDLESVLKAKRELEGIFKKTIYIVSKIETKEAVLNIDKLLSASDEIMIGRGDLVLHYKLLKKQKK